ncbi:MAG TPA: NBR1-Ig-like domain-containing protein, partial [Caldilineaceae bacterium]|nr:NBR1-Ig-like domain-containing protein [Caldilineaceae bacterium]
PADSTPCGADDGIVRDHWIAAAAPGQIVLSVGSLVVVQHNDVWSTGYYHVAQSGRRSVLDDQLRIGHPSNGCVGGGYSTTSHVHFTIRENGVMIPIAGQKLSGWIVEETRLVRENDPSQIVPLGRLVPSEPAPPPAPLNHTKPISIPASWWYTFHTSSGGDFQARLDQRDLFTVKGPARCGNGAKTLFLERGVYRLQLEYQPAEVPAVEMLLWPAPIPCGATLPLPAADEPQPPAGQVGLSPDATLDGVSLIEQPAPASLVAPGQALTYTWRLKNSGGSTWDQRYSLVFVGGTWLGAATETTLPAVAPAQETDLSVLLRIPASTPAGEYAGYFRLRNGQGAYFGPILSARVRVAAANGDTALYASQAIAAGATLSPSLALTPSLAVESRFIVTWTTATQGANAHDVQFFRQPDGPWLDWLVEYPQASAIFSGQPGHTYCFRSRAHAGPGAPDVHPWQAGGCWQINPMGATPELWWDAAYSYRRGLLVANLMSSVPLTVGRPLRLYLDDTTSPTAQALYAASASVVKGEDVRLVYQDALELERQVIHFTPSAIDIRFVAQAEIAPNDGSAAYALYYGNSRAGAPPPPPPVVEEEPQPFAAAGEPDGEPAPIVLLGRERAQAAPGPADLALSSLAAQPDGKGNVRVQAVVENRGIGSTQTEFFVHLFQEHAPETPATLADSRSHWIIAPLAPGQAVTLSTVLTGLRPMSGTDQVMAVAAVADSTGVISDANRTDNTHPAVQFCLAGEDAFEGDNDPSAAPLQPLGATTTHNFGHAGDQDWLRFAAEAGVTYHLYTHNPGEPVDTWLALYGPDGSTLLAENDDHAGGVSSYLKWVAPKRGVYFVQVRPWNPTQWGCNTGYHVAILSGDTVLTPVLAAPADGAMTQAGTLTLTWQAVPGLEKYRLQIAACPDFSTTRVDTQVNSLSYTATGLSNGVYHWRVQGAGADGRWGEWSPAWRFTVAPAGASDPQQPSPLPGDVPLFLPLLQRPGC